MARVVIVGGGFAGLAAARRLAHEPVEVTLVDRHNFHTFLPLLYQVATAGLEPADVAYPLRTALRRAPNLRFRHGLVNAVDLDRGRVELADGTFLVYDELVIACGARAAFFGVPGARDHALTLYDLADARRLRNRLLAILERADTHPDQFDGGAPRFVVVGGGPTGVETAGAILELLDVAIRHDGLRLDPNRTRVVLVDATTRLLGGFAAPASRYAEATLLARGVELRLGSPVAEVCADGVRLHDGEFLAGALVVWAAGVSAEGTLAANLGVERTSGGRVVVAPDLSLPSHPRVSVVGDCAAIPLGPGREGLCPQLAPVAIQAGRHAAEQVLRRTAGLPTLPFSYRDKGMMATIGRRAAVAQLGRGIVVRGTVGWVAWLGLHLVELIGFRNRVTVLVNWAWRYFDWPSGPRLIVADVEAET